MKLKILFIFLLMTAMAFACSKKIDVDNSYYAFTLLNIDNTGIKYQHNDNPWTTPVKTFMKDEYNFFYYSELDSNTLVYAKLVEDEKFKATVYFVRFYEEMWERDFYEKKQPMAEIINYELHRIFLEGPNKTSEYDADSLSKHILEKLNEAVLHVVNSHGYDHVVYNEQCYNGYKYVFEDKAVVGTMCPELPMDIINELRSCNAMLDAQAIEKSAPSLQTSTIHFNIQNRNITVSGIERPTDIIFFNPLGKMLEKHRVSKANATITSRLPAGFYIMQIKGHGRLTTQTVNIE